MITIFLLVVLIGAVMWVVFIEGSAHDGPAVQAQKNVSYCGTNNPDQTLNITTPAGDAVNTPIVAYIHGGGWRQGYKDNSLIRTYAPQFLRHGIAVADIGYRLKTPHPYPEQNNDIACALHFLTDNQKRYGIDMTKLVLFGDSAGGQLAASAALSVTTAKYPYPRPVGVIDFYGVTDFTKIVSSPRPDKNARLYLGALYAQDASAASPVTMVTADAPPFLIVHGDKDNVVPLAQSQELYDTLKSHGVDTQLYVIPGVKHSFVGPELAPNVYERLRDMIDQFVQRVFSM